MNNYEYPEGADIRDAPWNEEEGEEIEVTVSVTLSSTQKITVPKDCTKEEIKIIARNEILSDIKFNNKEDWCEDDFEAIKE